MENIKILLIGGAENTGKSGIIRKLVVDFLLNKNFKVRKLLKNEFIKKVYRERIEGKELIDNQEFIIDYIKEKKYDCCTQREEYSNDYFCLLKKEKTKIIVSTASDIEIIIDNFKKYCNENNPYDFIIAPIRNENDVVRDDFFRIMKINKDLKNIVELPLAKIYKNKNYDKVKALRWYEEKIFLIAQKILEQEFFNIKQK